MFRAFNQSVSFKFVPQRINLINLILTVFRRYVVWCSPRSCIRSCLVVSVEILPTITELMVASTLMFTSPLAFAPSSVDGWVDSVGCFQPSSAGNWVDSVGFFFLSQPSSVVLVSIAVVA